MREPETILRAVLPAAAQVPFVAEQVVVDATNALRGADVGLRHLRSRPLLRRVWGFVTGHEQQMHAAIGQDLVAAERATTNLVKGIMTEGIRTQYCIGKVLENLRAVNHDLDKLMAREASLELEIHQRFDTVQATLYAEIKRSAAALETDISHVRGLVQREAAVRRLENQFRADSLYPGMSHVISAALYLSQVARIFAGDLEQQAQQEWQNAKLVIRQQLMTTQGVNAVYVPTFLAQTVEEIHPAALEMTAYIVFLSSGPTLKLLSSLIERRMVQLPFGGTVATDSFRIVKSFYDPDDRLPLLLRPQEVAEQLASELLSSDLVDGR